MSDALGLGQDADEIGLGQSLELDPDRQPALQLGQQVRRLRDVERAAGDEQDVIGLDRSVLGRDGGALDQRQQVALNALAADRAAAHIADRYLVDLVQKDDAVLLGGAHRVAVDVVGVEPLVALLGDEHLPCRLDRHLAALGLGAAHRLPQHLGDVDHLRLAGDLERRRRGILDLDLDLAALQLAVAEALPERQPRRLAGVLADQHVEQPRFRCRFRLVLDPGAPVIADQPDRLLDKVADDRIDVAPDVTDLGELRRLDLQERRVGELRQPPADLGLAAPRRPDHQDVLRVDLVAQVVAELLPPPAVAERYRDRALGVVLADDVAIERANNLARRQGSDIGGDGKGHVHPMLSTVRLLLV